MSADQMTGSSMPDVLYADVETLWNYHRLDHEPRRCDVGIGLGSHDLGVADHVIGLYRDGMFPLIVFTGANAPTTIEIFPRGEAVHYAEHATAQGIPADVIRIEPKATNTGENITNTRRLLESEGVTIRTAILACRPYQARRAYATAAKLWPDVEFVCPTRPIPLDQYVASIGDTSRVINMLVGDTQRIWVYADHGHAIEQPIPDQVHNAYRRLVDAGYTRRLLPDEKRATQR